MGSLQTVNFYLLKVLLLCSSGVLSCLVPSTPQNTPDDILDYYWRDYVGIIPLDAIPGGRNKAGLTTYIGQVYGAHLELLPGIIEPFCKSAVVTRNVSAVETDKNVKILCGRQLYRYRWIPINANETHLLTDCHLVKGGHEINYDLNIGRVYNDGEVLVGKVFSAPIPGTGLWIPYNGKPVNFLSYQILTYGC